MTSTQIYESPDYYSDPVCYAYKMWKLVHDGIKASEIYAYRHGEDITSEMAIHHAIAENEYWEENWEENYDDLPEPVDCSPNAKKFCKTCFKAQKDTSKPSVYHDHHTGQVFSCPSISDKCKKVIAESF